MHTPHGPTPLNAASTAHRIEATPKPARHAWDYARFTKTRPSRPSTQLQANNWPGPESWREEVESVSAPQPTAFVDPSPVHTECWSREAARVLRSFALATQRHQWPARQAAIPPEGMLCIVSSCIGPGLRIKSIRRGGSARGKGQARRVGRMHPQVLLLMRACMCVALEGASPPSTVMMMIDARFPYFFLHTHTPTPQYDNTGASCRAPRFFKGSSRHHGTSGEWDGWLWRV